MVDCYERERHDAKGFQYSLCRVVLMVALMAAEMVTTKHFQYSLCRVVLMVFLEIPDTNECS